MKFLEKFFSRKEPISLPPAKIIEPYTYYSEGQIRYITEFKNGYALAIINNSYIYMLNTEYEISLRTPYYIYSRSIIKHYRYFIATNDANPASHRYVFLNKELKEVPDLQYANIELKNGYFEVDNCELDERGKIKEHFLGLLNENLELVLPTIYKSFTTIGKDSFFCEAHDGKNIIFNAVSRKTIDATNFSQIYSQNDYGWYKFKSNDNLFGYLDSNFDIIIPPKYHIIADKFDENGYMPFSRDNIVGVLDTSGKELVF